MTCRCLYTCSWKAERGQNEAHIVLWMWCGTTAVLWIKRIILQALLMHICPWFGASISSINHNYFYTCKVQIINIRVTMMMYHPCATAASKLLLMTHKDVNNYTVYSVHHCNAPWLVVDSLFILRALLFHCMLCKMGSLALNIRMWKMEILGKMAVDIVDRKPQTIPTISR